MHGLECCLLIHVCFDAPGKEQEAVDCIRKALDLHPFAANLPTVLQSIKTMPKGEAEFKSNDGSPEVSDDGSGDRKA